MKNKIDYINLIYIYYILYNTFISSTASKSYYELYTFKM